VYATDDWNVHGRLPQDSAIATSGIHSGRSQMQLLNTKDGSKISLNKANVNRSPGPELLQAP